ncbi:unnamed protein product [Gadus morhua 'NCC']
MTFNSIHRLLSRASPDTERARTCHQRQSRDTHSLHLSVRLGRLPFPCLRLRDFEREDLGPASDSPDPAEPGAGAASAAARTRTAAAAVIVGGNKSDPSCSSSPTSDFPQSSSAASLSAPGSMWQQAMRRKKYLLERAGESGAAGEPGGGAGGGGGGGGGRGGSGRERRRIRSPDWLYESYYCMSQQHPLIVFLLLIVMGACLALLVVFFASGLNIEDHVAFVITVPTAMAIFLAVFVLVCVESIFKKLLRVFSLVIWACLVVMGYLFMFFGGIICPWDQVSFFLFIVFVAYTMLPFSMREAIIASVLTSTSHTVVLIACLYATTDRMGPVVWQVGRCSLCRSSAPLDVTVLKRPSGRHT